MSSTITVPTHVGAPAEARWPLNLDRGLRGMYAVICTEATLFVCLFASYYFLGTGVNRWQVDQPPTLHYALILLVVLLVSSFVLVWGERQVRAERYSLARFALWLTILLGLAFMVIQVFEYKEHLKTLSPRSDSYGSIFYAITSFHAAHVIVGILILGFVGFLPHYGPELRPPYRPYRVAALYWHFVDIVWIFVVLLLYVIPNLQVRM